MTKIVIDRPRDPLAGMIASYRSLTFAQVNELLRYDQDTGKLFWKERTPEMFRGSTGKNSPSHNCCRWNTRYAGKEAFTANDGEGYLRGRIHHGMYRAHRVVWLLNTGRWPDDQIDHIDGNRANNRIENLREASHTENSKNRRLPEDNKSGVIGVCWNKRSGKWCAQIQTNGRHKTIGRFSSFHEAVAARKSAEAENGYHPNHGRR